MTNLADKTCIPCRGGVPALKGEELSALASQVPLWQVVNEHHLTRKFEFPDFLKTLAFVNRVGEVAEQQDHHPDICFTWGKAEISIFLA